MTIDILEKMPQTASAATGEVILDVLNLRTSFRGRGGVARAVDGVSFALRKGETLGIVGESGCGKSVTSLSIMRLLPQPPAEIEADALMFAGTDLATASESDMRRLRGNRLSMIFQDPMTSLNPVLKIGRQLTEGLIVHSGLSSRGANERALKMLALVRVPEPSRIMRSYPHELSGGMRQRIMIAMALSTNPEVLIADEPTTALDVTIQAQILSLMAGLRERFDTGIIMITHDLGVVAETCDRVLVMYGGRVVEEATVDALFARPAHPYTVGLMRAVPRLDHAARKGEPYPLAEIPGVVPPLTEAMPGCRFAPRCAFATLHCHAHKPELQPVGDRHRVACFETERVMGAVNA